MSRRLPAAGETRNTLAKHLVGRASSEGESNQVPGLADWFLLGEPAGIAPQAAAQATGWPAASPATRGLAVVSGWEPNVTATHAPDGIDWVANCEPANDGFVHDLSGNSSSGDQGIVTNWTTSSGFVCFRMAAAGATQFLSGFVGAAGNRRTGLAINAAGQPMVVLEDNADYYRVFKNVALSAAAWHTLGFVKSAAAAARLFLDGVELTGLTVESNTHGATDWLDVYTDTEDSSSFSLAGRITNEGTREFTQDANVKLAAFGWCQAELADAAFGVIHNQYLG